MLLKFTFDQLKQRAKYKPTGYIDDVLEASEYNDIEDCYMIDTESEEYKLLVDKYSNKPKGVPFLDKFESIYKRTNFDYFSKDTQVRYKEYLKMKKFFEDILLQGTDLSPENLIKHTKALCNIFGGHKFEYVVQQYKKANVKPDCKNCAEQVYINRLLWEFMQAYKRLPYKKQLEVIKLLRYEPEVIDVNPVEEPSS